jgi:hypothetical protein
MRARRVSSPGPTRSSPGSPAAVRRNSATVSFESCDPGTSANVGQRRQRRLAGYCRAGRHPGQPRRRSRALRGTGGGGTLPLRSSRSRVHVKQLSDPTFGANDPAVRTRIQQLAAGCR